MIVRSVYVTAVSAMVTDPDGNTTFRSVIGSGATPQDAAVDGQTAIADDAPAGSLINWRDQ